MIIDKYFASTVLETLKRLHQLIAFGILATIC